MKNTKQKIDVSGFLKMEDEECMKNTKQTSKHTAGEWEYDDELNIFGKTGDQYLIASVHFDDEDGCHKNEAEANARLIASAPLMLSALELCKMHLNGHPITKDQALKSINEAIATAKGE